MLICHKGGHARPGLALAAVLALALAPGPASAGPAAAAAPLTPVAPLAPVAPAPSQALRQLTTQAAALEKALRAVGDPLERKRLTEELEKVKHQMGPVDAGGARVRCQAMWHDSALESLDAEIRRLSGRSGALAAAGAAADLRLASRRMARASLAYGWAAPAEAAKYQVDAFGAYLANNSRALDALYDSVGAWIAKEARTADAGEDAGPYPAALQKARQGLDQMARAADAMAEAPPDAEAPPVPSLGDFVAGLRAVREADQAVREFARKKGKAAAPAADAAEPEPPPMTAREQERLARVRETAASLKGDEWAQVAPSLERFAAAVEAGFQVPSARPKARQLMDQIELAAHLAQGLALSKAAGPDYRRLRQGELAAALREVESADTRPAGYQHIAAAWQDDDLRRQLEQVRLSPQAVGGLINAYYFVAEKLRKEGSADPALAIRTGCPVVAAALLKAAARSTRDMAPRLAECCLQQEKLFKADAEAAGAAFPADPAAGVPKIASAAARAADLELLVRADAAVKTVAKYRPARAVAVYGRLAKAAMELVGGAAGPSAPRQALEEFVQPLETLAHFPLPEGDLARVAGVIAGRALGPATAALSQAVAAGIDALAAGDAAPLKQALDAQPMFGLLRQRAVAAVTRLDKVPVANLVTFSLPEKVWGAFMASLDQKLQTTFAQYASGGAPRAAAVAASADWEALYTPVLAGARLTADARTEGETDLDLLLRNLERAAVPAPAAEASNAWAVGYHAAEAAASAGAGFDTVAAWHRLQVRSLDNYLRAVDLEPPRKDARGR